MPRSLRPVRVGSAGDHDARRWTGGQVLPARRCAREWYDDDPCLRSQSMSTMAPPLLDVRNLVKEFSRKQGLFRKPSAVRAVDDVSFSITEGETFGLVGESGSGKTTTGRCILRLI